MHLKSSLLLLFAFLVSTHASAQVAPSPRAGVQAGFSPMRNHQLIPAQLGEYGILHNRAFQGGVHVAVPLSRSGVEVSLAAAYLEQSISFFYLGPGTLDTDALGAVQLQSLLLTPSVAWRPSFAKGFFVDLGMPVALAIGNGGSFVHTTTTLYEQTEANRFPKIAKARNGVYTGPELGMGYRFRLGSRSSFSARVAGWMSVTDLFHANNDLIVTWQQRIRPSLEIGWSFDLKAS